MSEDFTRTLEEVVAGFTGGQQTASLLSQSVMTPLGAVSNIPPPSPVQPFTPPPSPVLPHLIPPLVGSPEPAMMSNPTTAYAQNAFQPVGMGMGMGMGAGPMPMMATMPPPPPMPPPMMPMPPMQPVGMQQGLFQQGMGLAQQNQIMNPAMAMYMSQQGGMMPDANMMMSAQYGNMRRDVLMDQRNVVPMGIPGGGQGIPNALLPIDAFQRTRPELQFSRGYDSAMYHGLETSRLLEQGYNAYAQSAGGLVANAVATPVTTGIGAGIGGYFGGPSGAMQGAEIGMMVGQLAQHIPGVDRAVSAALRPSLERRADAIQMQYASRQFLIGGGSDVDISGTGVSGRVSQRMTSGMDDIAAGSQGALTRQDAVMLMQAGGEQGLMDWAQNADQIVQTTKTMSKVLGTFAEITGDPDFMNNIKKMGALSRMGIGLNDMDSAMRNMDQYARMAGMDVDQLMQNEGLQGAQMFKAAGLGAGIGMQNRMFTAAQARQLVAGGAFNEQQLDLYGGTEGVGQTMAEINAAYLSKVSQPLMSYLVGGRDASGNLTLDQSKIDKLTSGEISYQDALQIGSNRDLRPGDLSDMLSQMKELTTQLGKQMGPEGVQRAALQAAIDLNNSTGGQMGLRGAAMTMYDEAGGAMVGRMSNADYQQGVLAQMQKEMDRREFDADAALSAGGGGTGFLARRGIALEGFDAYAARGYQGVSDWVAGLEENKRLSAVGVTRFTKDTGLEGFSGAGALRGGEGAAGPSTRFDFMLGRDRSAARQLLTGTAYERTLQKYGTGIDRQLDVFGDERALSRYLEGRDGMFGTAQDYANQYAENVGLMFGIGDGGASSTRNRDARVTAGAKAYRLGLGGESAGLARGRDQLEEVLGAGGLSKAAGKLAAGQGRSEGREDVVSALLLANPLTLVAGGANAALQSMGVDVAGELGLRLGDAGQAITDERIAEATGLSLDQVSALSPEARGALINEATAAMTIEEEKEFRGTSQGAVNAGMTDRIGKHYLRSGAGAQARLDDVLGKAGFDSYDDLSKAEKAAIGAIAGSGTEDSRKYLAIAALRETGETDKQALADQMYAELAKKDPDARDKIRNAKRLLAGMSSDARDELVANITGLIGGGESAAGMKKMGGAGALAHMEANLQQITQAGEGIKQVERFAATRAKLEDVVSMDGVDDDLSLMSKAATATGDDEKALREVLGDEAVDLAQATATGDVSDEDLALFAQLTSRATSAESGKVDMSSKRGTADASTEEQGRAIAAQKAFFAQLNASTQDNSSELRSLTGAVRSLNQTMAGGSAESLKNKQRGF